MFEKFKNLQLVVLTWVAFLLNAKTGRKPFCLNVTSYQKARNVGQHSWRYKIDWNNLYSA